MDGEKAEYKNEYHRRKYASQDKKSIERIQPNLEILVQLVEMFRREGTILIDNSSIRYKRLVKHLLIK